MSARIIGATFEIHCCASSHLFVSLKAYKFIALIMPMPFVRLFCGFPTVGCAGCGAACDQSIMVQICTVGVLLRRVETERVSPTVHMCNTSLRKQEASSPVPKKTRPRLRDKSQNNRPGHMPYVHVDTLSFKIMSFMSPPMTVVSPIDRRACCRCNILACACYASAGVVFGAATGGAAVPAAVVGCNAGLGSCMAACWGVTGAAAVTPTP